MSCEINETEILKETTAADSDEALVIKMSEAQIKKAITKMNSTEEYITLKKYYSEESFLKTLGVSRDEKAHSNFIAWLLSPTANHELNCFPLQKFLQMLSIVSQNPYNANCEFPAQYVDMFLLEDYKLGEDTRIETEYSTKKIAGFSKTGRIDILIFVQFKGSDKLLPIVIENKVLSTENKDTQDGSEMQTDKYYEWALKKFDGEEYERPIFVFLAPDHERDIQCNCEAFIKTSYQNLIDYVIEPCLITVVNQHAKFLIEDYLRCLSNSTLNNDNSAKEGKIMGIPSKELDVLRKFHEKNKELFDAVFAMLELDAESDDERASIKKAHSASAKHDYSKYTIVGDGTEYRKGPLLVALVKKYIADNINTDLKELKEKFDLVLTFGKKSVVLEASEVPPSWQEKVEKLTLADGTDVYINKQVQKEDIPDILNIAAALGYDVEKV